MLAAAWAPRHTPRLLVGRTCQGRLVKRTVTFQLARPNHLDLGGFGNLTFGMVLTRPLGENASKFSYSTNTIRTRDRMVDLLKGGNLEEASAVHAEWLAIEGSHQPSGFYRDVMEEILTLPDGSQYVDTLFRWMESFPDAQDSSSNDFHEILRLLNRTPDESSMLIKRFGVLCASKGYMNFVETDISPIVSKLNTSDAFDAWQTSVDEAATTYTGVQTPAGMVFEEPSGDYSSILAESIPSTPSVLQLVEDTLPSTLPASIPSDNLIFEDESDDYVTYALQDAIQSPADTLAQLVRDEKYDEAHHLLRELQELSVDVPFSRVYEKAANAAIRASLIPSEDSSLQEQEEQFVAWFSLIPPLHAFKSRIPTFSQTRRLIFHSPVTNLQLVIKMATILASKGFADLVSNKAIPLVLHFTSPGVSKQFLQNFEKANEKYWLDHDPAQSAYMIKKVLTNTRGAAVRSLAHAGRFDMAVELLPNPEAPTFRLTIYTYEVLLRLLSASDSVEAKEHIALVETLRKDDATVVNNVAEESGPSTMVEDAELVSNADYLSPLFLGANLAASLRYLKKVVGTEGNTTKPIHPYTILSFMEAYHSTGRSRALTVLLNRAIRASYTHTSSFIFAEMLYYYRRQQHSLVVETFVDHCYISGVPRTDVVNHYSRYQHLRSTHDPESLGHPPPSRFHAGGPKLLNGRIKLWPAAVHCNLVWHSLAAVAPHDTAVERLYNKLIQILRDGKEDSQSTYFSQIAALSPPPGWKKGPTAAAFTPFMKRLMLAHGPPRGMGVMNDMLKLSIEPTVYHFTELAGQYARIGDEKRAFMILDRIEANLEKAKVLRKTTEQNSQDASSSTEVPTESANTKHSRDTYLASILPDLVMYISLMRGFIISKNIKAAEEVDRRLRLRVEYTPGDDQYLDAVYEDLHLLKQELGNTDQE